MAKQQLTLSACRYDGSKKFSIKDAPTSAKADTSLRSSIEVATADNTRCMTNLQDKLYAEGREGVIILFQAMDAAGKDSTIRRVMSGLNPQGVHVASFKQPSDKELSHDYLWRAVSELPERGTIALFNRSYYEDVLVARVHHLERSYRMPARCLADDPETFYARRYKQIRCFEEYLYEEGYRLIKIFLNESEAEQKKRFLERIDNPAKNWKFSETDISERALWPQYKQAYERAINETATKHAPWFAIPADQKWYTRWLVSEAVVEVLKACNPTYPQLPAAKKSHLAEYRRLLMKE